MNIYLKNTLRVLYYGWCDSRKITSKGGGGAKSRIPVYLDIIRCFKKYGVLSSQYLNHEFYRLSDLEKENISHRLMEKNKKRDYWETVYNNNWQFLNKYSSLVWETTNRKKKYRTNAYIKHFGLGKGCWVQYGVMFICEHCSVGKLNIGKNVLFARGCDIDYTGDLTIKDNVKLSEGTKILTHNHSLNGFGLEDSSEDLILTPLCIQEDVQMGARALIMPGVGVVGRCSYISSNSVVRKEVPPYAIIMGNPSMVVGFRYTPDQILELEEEQYPENERIPEETLRSNYKKYYLDRLEYLKKSLS